MRPSSAAHIRACMFVLAAAGLLRGCRAATHWAWCDVLAAAYPHVRVEREPVWVEDGGSTRRRA